jgi:hypothetical protein
MCVTIATNSVGPGFVVGVEPEKQGYAAGANIANTNGTFSLENSILAYPGTTNYNAYGPITDAGYNICSDGSADFDSGSSFNSTDPLLRPLGYYGGPTLTMALPSNSPAINAGTDVGAPATDQRGLPRPSGTFTDMGAYELQPGAQSPTLKLTLAQELLQLSFQAQSNTYYSLQSSGTLSNWQTIQMIGPPTSNGQVNITIGYNAGSNNFFRLYLP